MKTRIPFKLLAALTALCLLLSLGAFSAMADEEPAEDIAPVSAPIATDEGEEAALQALNLDLTRALASGLHFDGVDSEFKILVFSDLNDGAIPYTAMLKYIEAVLADPAVAPDLIVLNGDNTRKGASTFGVTSFAIPWICDLFGDIPFTLTFGENDALLPVSKNNYLGRYQRYANCLAYDNEREGAAGVGNHNLLIFNDETAAEAGTIDGAAFDLWLMDTNVNGFNQNQSAWYAIREEDGVTFEAGYRIPSMLFTHFPLHEMYTQSAAAGLTDPTAKLPVEHRMFTMMKTYGNVLAAVSGHHRAKSFVANWEYDSTLGAERSIDFIQCPGMTYLTCSGTERATRGATLITLKLNALGEEAVIDIIDEVETVVAEAIPPEVEITEVRPLPAFPYFDDGGELHNFYKAGVNWLFGPLSSLIGLIASPFTDKYQVAFNVTQFFGNVFGWMLGK